MLQTTNEQSWSFIDKSEWGNGEWRNEPDKIQYVDQHTGFPCLIVRNKYGALCGYVGISEGHPLFGVSYNEFYLNVHGGVTFTDFCQEDNKEQGICHVPEPGQSDRIYWIGFDTAHSGDLVPAMAKDLKDYFSFYTLNDQCTYQGKRKKKSDKMC